MRGSPAQLKQLLTLAVGCLKQGDPKGAEAHLRRAQKMAPGQPDVEHLLGSALGQSGQLDEAQRAVTNAIQRDPQRAAFHNTLGNICRAQGAPRDAMRAYARAIDLEPRMVDARFNLGLLQLEAGDVEAAVEAFDLVLSMYPAHFDALMQRGLVASRAHDSGAAGRFFEAAARARPQSPDALYSLAATLYQQGDYPSALVRLTAALELAPERAAPRLLQARTQRAMGRLALALATLDGALEQHPGQASLLAERGGVLQALGRLDAAHEAFRAALEQGPVAATAASLAELHLWRGDIEDARATLAPFTAAESTQVAIMQARIALARKSNAPDPAPLQAWLEDAPRAGLSRIEQRQLAFCLGDVWHARGNADAAFEYYAQGNALDTLNVDMAGVTTHVDTNIRFFDRARFETLARTDAADVGPVFIVGMPRSGTTLLEQMLGMHSRIVPLGERADIGSSYYDVLGGRALDEALLAQTTGQLNAIARAYLAAQPYAKPCRWITDKMPLNFLYLGYIAMVFPKARIVHCQRAPEAIALSCFRQDFNDPALGFSRDLVTLGHYMAEHDRLMAHWREVLPMPVTCVKYEDLIDDAPAQISTLLEWLELEFEPACLEFSGAQRFVNTASHAQVRQGLYRNAVARHERYAQALAPFRLSYAQHSSRSAR